MELIWKEKPLFLASNRREISQLLCLGPRSVSEEQGGSDVANEYLSFVPAGLGENCWREEVGERQQGIVNNLQ